MTTLKARLHLGSVILERAPSGRWFPLPEFTEYAGLELYEGASGTWVVVRGRVPLTERCTGPAEAWTKAFPEAGTCPRQHLSQANEQRILEEQGPCMCANCVACRKRGMT